MLPAMLSQQKSERESEWTMLQRDLLRGIEEIAKVFQLIINEQMDARVRTASVISEHQGSEERRTRGVGSINQSSAGAG